MVIVEIPIRDSRKPPKPIFPERCVNCGKSKAKTLPLKLGTDAQTKSGQIIQLEKDVPLCVECAANENRIGNVTWMPFFVVGSLTWVVVFIAVWLIAPEGTTPQTSSFPYVLGAFVGMIAGILIGTLVEVILKMIFAPSYGRLLLKRPLTVFTVFNDSEDFIGLSIRFANQKKTVKLTFENDKLAREFSVLNPQEKE